jgi:PAS domain S-box-containing protein
MDMPNADGQPGTASPAEFWDLHRVLFEAAPHGIVIQDGEGAILNANPEAQRCLGLSLDQMQGRTSIDPRWKALREDGSAFPGEFHPAMVALRTGRPTGSVVMGVYDPMLERTNWLDISAVPVFHPGQARPSQVFAMFVDITARKLNEDARRVSEERLHRMARAGRIGLGEWNIREDKAWWSAEAFELVGLRPDASIAVADWLRRIHPEDREMVMRQMGATLEAGWTGQEGAPIRKEYRVVHDDGSVHWLETVVSLEREGDERILRGVGRDITEARQMKEDLQRREAELAEAQEIAHLGSWRVVFTETGATWSGSAQLHRIFGRALDPRFDPETLYRMMPPEDRERARAAWEAAMEGHGPKEWERRIVVDGRVKWVRVRARFLRDAGGRVTEGAGVVEDITARKLAEGQLQEQAQLLRLFIQHAPVRISMLDRELRFLHASGQWLRDFGLREEDVLGRACYDLFPEIPERWREIHRRCLAGATERCEEDSYTRSDGQVEWLRWEVRPWLDASQAVGGIIIMSELITARRVAEQALRDCRVRMAATEKELQRLAHPRP